MEIILCSLASLIPLRWGDVHPFFRIPNWVVKFSRGTDRGQQQTNQLREHFLFPLTLNLQDSGQRSTLWGLETPVS